jgi:signal peptidase
MKALHVALNVISILLTALAAVLLLAFTAVPNVLGYKTYVVLSGSMEPAIHTGAVVVATAVPPSSLNVGDVIVYNRSDVDERVTHRIIDVQDDGGKRTFTTKGDANAAPDAWTVQYSQNTAGKVVFTVPYVGYINNALESPRGRMVFVIVPVVVLAGMWLWQIWRPAKPAEAQAPAAAAVAAQPAPAVPVMPAEPPASRLGPVNLQAGAPEPGSLPLRQ